MAQTFVRPDSKVISGATLRFQSDYCAFSSLPHPSEIRLIFQADRTPVGGVWEKPLCEVILNLDVAMTGRVLRMSDVDQSLLQVDIFPPQARNFAFRPESGKRPKTIAGRNSGVAVSSKARTSAKVRIPGLVGSIVGISTSLTGFLRTYFRLSAKLNRTESNLR